MALFTVSVLTQSEGKDERSYGLELLVQEPRTPLLAEVEHRTGQASWSDEAELEITLRRGTDCCTARKAVALLPRERVEELQASEHAYVDFEEVDEAYVNFSEDTSEELDRAVAYCGECGLLQEETEDTEVHELITWVQEGGSLQGLPPRYPEDPSPTLYSWLGLHSAEPLRAQLLVRELEDVLDEFFAVFCRERGLTVES